MAMTDTHIAESPGPSLLLRLDSGLTEIPRRLLLLLCDSVSITAALYLALAIRLSLFPLNAEWTGIFFKSLGPLLLIGLTCQAFCGVYRLASRHTGLRDMKAIGLAVLGTTALFSATIHFTRVEPFPRSALFISGLLHFFLLSGSRIAYRLLLESRLESSGAHKERRRKRILIVGAGRVGVSLARDLRNSASDGLNLIGFLDDKSALRNHRIDGTPVLGRTEDVRRIVMNEAVDTIIVAMASPPALLIREITRCCEGLKVRLQVAPGLIGLRRERALPAVRDIAFEDLLPRREIVTDKEEISGYLYGERVLVTGAGGSIGSELVRQILSGNPAEIILLGHGENSVFDIEQELKRSHNRVPVSLIADVRDYDRLLMLFLQHRPTVVFHAAAHKHVALMEGNLEEAVTNNVLGTRNLARVAGQTGVKRFVMISTDKAVNPTSIMGVSKRIAEMVVQVESRRTLMELATVRFGNVLGSRGSVIPLMQKQIQQGGPVTVTHPDAMRYFMTIPEAVQLVIQAGALGGRGTIYMLDMGEPVRIMDMALDLIRLSGFTPDKEIPVEIIGLKPGEKLFEELLTAEEGASVTRHQRIYAAKPAPFPIEDLDAQVDALIQAARKGDTAEILRKIQALVPGFTGSQMRAVTALREEPLVTAVKQAA